MPTLTSVDAYIAACPTQVQVRLREVRAVILKVAPGAQETISYRIPAYVLHGALVYFAAFKTHVGVYPITGSVKRELGAALEPYLPKGAKATVRFPIDRAIPKGLLARIVRVRVREQKARQALRDSSRVTRRRRSAR